MKYLLLICVDPSIEPDEEPGEIEAGWSVSGTRG